MEKSLWKDKTLLPEFKTLKKDIKTDILIIGGGMAGILCAYFLKGLGIKTVLVEQNRIAHGVTKNTTAKITSQHGLIYSYLISKFGVETAKKYLKANEDAVQKFRELSKNIPCDFENLSSYVYSIDSPQKIEEEKAALSRLGYDAKLEYTSSLPFDVSATISFKNQAQFNPLEFIKFISKDLDIYENTKVHEIQKGHVVSSGGMIWAKKIIVTTHFPFLNKHGSYFLKLYQHRSYVLALENTPKIKGMYVDEKEDGLSFRTSGDLLLLGGCGGRTGKSCGNWEKLTDFKNRFFPDSKVKYLWATQDCMSLDKIPYIGQYSKNTPNLFVATGFNKWGMTSSMVSASILCDMVQDKHPDYADIFSPSRSILKPQLFVNGLETMSNFLNPTLKRCPHLGCALKWNKAEHTWDCPCHGSRFKDDGTLINNPATKDADALK